MDEQNDLISQLEGALASRDLSKRAEMLGRVTDLFMLGSGRFTPAQIDLFDEVMGRLVEQIESTVRAAFGSRMARCPDAPGKVIRLLAFDDAIEVAAPVLRDSVRLDDVALVENARTRSQAHLLAISERASLAEPVTDVLVDRGNQLVAASTARNRGARFSASGFSTLTRRSQDDGDLALCVWSRPDIPRQELMKLFGQATEAVRRRLEAADPRRAAQIRNAVASAADEIQATARVGSHEHAAAVAHVRSLHSHGQLDEARLFDFAHRRDFDRTTVALSLRSDVPVGLIERALTQDEVEQVLVIAKAIDLSWETTKAMLMLKTAPGADGSEAMNRTFASYFRLKTKTARAALQFYRLRQRADADPGTTQ
jgi:uncharacterized protein (DUF2336 family)